MSAPSRYCTVCTSYDKDDPLHSTSSVHQFNQFLQNWNQCRKSLFKDRHGCKVKITPILENGIILSYNEHPNKGKLSVKISPTALASVRNTLNFKCTVENCRKKDKLLLTSSIILFPHVYASLKDPNDNFDNGKILELEAGASYSVTVTFSSGKETLVGSFKIPVSFSFQTFNNPPETFSIVKTINISVEEVSNKHKKEELSKSPFTSNDWPDHLEIFSSTTSHNLSNQYPIPFEYWKFLKLGLQHYNGMRAEDYQILEDIKKQLYPGHVTLYNYRKFWHFVLWLEEMGAALGLKRYNMENVNLKRKPDNLLELMVPGLAEKRPSVIAGDFIELKVHEDYRGYRGVIKAVNDNSVDIGYVDEEFLDAVSTIPNLEIDVRFVLGRLPLERMHQAVDQIVLNQTLPNLFPDSGRRPASPRKSIIEFYNPLIPSNYEQKTAVLNILNATSNQAPYIVFGPPGTGKTITIVEAILQIKKKTTKNILVCAPANAACDFLTEKLMKHCQKNELIRVMSENVDINSIHENILSYSNYEGDGIFRKVTPEELLDYRIVVTTLILIGRYHRKYHPDVVFVDEAAQACEPEVNCAIAMLKVGKQIVLAGDPRQLGPTVCSKIAVTYGLDKSLLERLMDLPLYSTLDPNFITMLKLNFRSHSTILRLPNEIFYSDQLEARSITSQNDPVAKICIFKKVQEMFGNKASKNAKDICSGQAVEFCGVISKESRQGRSPSYYNEKEVLMVLKYILTLTSLEFENDDQKVKYDEIGVVTPYIRQVYKIREMLKSNNIEGVDVGTTETFQGREKRIIIITTVRAQKDLLAFDKKYNLGFVKHEKRFNVALTRAMSKLIVIGCAHVLATDSNWLRYIEFCEELGVSCGAPIVRRNQDHINYIYKIFEKVCDVDSQNSHQAH